MIHRIVERLVPALCLLEDTLFRFFWNYQLSIWAVLSLGISPMLVSLNCTLSSFLTLVALETEKERRSFHNLCHLLSVWLCLIVNTVLFMFCDLPVLQPGGIKERYFSSEFPEETETP